LKVTKPKQYSKNRHPFSGRLNAHKDITYR